MARHDVCEVAKRLRRVPLGPDVDVDSAAAGRVALRSGVAQAAAKLLDGLIDLCCDWSQDTCGLLTHCTASYHDDAAGVHTNIVYGDYFFIEALTKLCGSDPMLWRR